MPMPVLHEEANLGQTICPLTIGRAFSPGGAGSCIGGQCMAWRYARTHIKNPDAPDGDLIPSGDTHGYCGLAGAPGQLHAAD